MFLLPDHLTNHLLLAYEVFLHQALALYKGKESLYTVKMFFRFRPIFFVFIRVITYLLMRMLFLEFNVLTSKSASFQCISFWKVKMKKVVHVGIVNRKKWFWNSTNFFVVGFCSFFFFTAHWETHQQKHFGYVIHVQCMSPKQKIVHGRGLSNINLGIFVCSFDVCRTL